LEFSAAKVLYKKFIKRIFYNEIICALKKQITGITGKDTKDSTPLNNSSQQKFMQDYYYS